MTILFILLIVTYIEGIMFGYVLCRLFLNKEVNTKVNERLSNIVFLKEFVEYKQRMLQSDKGLIPRLKKKIKKVF